jgi:hypothetical protein
LKEERLYDPKRRPPDLADALTPGQFAVFLSDARSGAGVGEDGRARRRGAAATCLVFDSLSEAKNYCQGLAERVSNLRCDIHDHHCKATDPLISVVNLRHAGTLPSRAKSRRMMIVGSLLIVPSLPLFLYDLLWHQLAWLWPTFIAINLLVIGLRTLHWGYMELENLRTQERAAAHAQAATAKQP